MPSYETTRQKTMEFIRKELQKGFPISLKELTWRAIEKTGTGEKFCHQFISRLIEIGRVAGKDEENLVWIEKESDDLEDQETKKDTSGDGDMEEYLQ